MRLVEDQSRRSLPVCALTVLAQRHHVARGVGDCSQYTVLLSRQWPPQILQEIAGGRHFRHLYGKSLYRGIIATTMRLAELTTRIRSSNFTNLWPRTSGISRMMPLGRSCIGTPSGKESATSGAGTSATGASE